VIESDLELEFFYLVCLRLLQGREEQFLSRQISSGASMQQRWVAVAWAGFVVVLVLLFFSVSPVTSQQSRTQNYDPGDCKYFFSRIMSPRSFVHI
jgi:hypothetical protein